jgi:hypothetical protein
MHPRTPTAQDSVDGTPTGPRTAGDSTPHPHSIDNLPDCRPTTACSGPP